MSIYHSNVKITVTKDMNSTENHKVYFTFNIEQFNINEVLKN